MGLLPHRTDKSIQGLNSMINYVNSIMPTKTMILIEIGAWVGVSTIEFAKHFASVIAIDPWQNNIGDITNNYDMNQAYEEYKNRISKFDNITTIKEFSYNIANKIDNSTIDIVYIDGLHTYEAVKKDIELFMPKIKKRGFISGHDYCSKFPGVIKAVNELFIKPDRIFVDTSWIKRID